MSKTAKKRVTLLFIGKTGKEEYTWRNLTGSEKDNDGRKFKDNAFDKIPFEGPIAAATPGQIFSFEVLSDKPKLKISLDESKYLGLWLNVDDVAEWQAAEDARKLRQIAFAEGKRQFSLEALKPIRDAYRGLYDPQDRVALLAQAISFITTREKEG